MEDTDKEWKQQEREIIDKFFAKMVRNVIPIDNQGSNSFTLTSKSLEIVIQFHLNPFRTDTHRLANEIYGLLVPEVKFHKGFALPVYSNRAITGRIHVLQPFPEAQFPLAREKTTVTELGAFVAKAAFFAQPKQYGNDSWTHTAADTLRRHTRNQSLKTLAPHLHTHIITILQPNVHLLETLPAVLTHHDFSQVNIFVNDSGHLTGVIDFDEAGIEAFGMCIWGLYEFFFGMMERGTGLSTTLLLMTGAKRHILLNKFLKPRFGNRCGPIPPLG